MATASETPQNSTTSPAKPAARRAGKAASAKPAAGKTAKPKANGATKADGAKPASRAKAASSAKAASAKPKTATRAARKSDAKPSKAENRQSRDSSMTGKEHDNHAERAWKLADRIGVAMFVTWDGERQRARPLAAHVEKEEGAIYFLTDLAGEKDDQIAEFPYVSVNFVDNRKARYVVFSGKATISNDRDRIRDLWSPFAKAFWDSPDDPSIRVIRMTPEDAELWDSPGRIVSTVSMLTSAVTGKTPKVGENAKIVL